MAKIQQYTSTEPTLRGSSVGFQSQPRGDGTIMQAVGSAMQEVGAAVTQRIEENESSKLMADFATAQAKLTNEAAKAFRDADPNDPDVGERFMTQTAEPLLAQLGETLQSRKGQQLYSRLKAGLMADLSVRTTVDQANLTGVAAVKNHQTLYNMVTSAAKTDPFNLDYSMGLADLWEEQTRGKLEADKLNTLATGMRKGIAAAVVTGLTDKGSFDQAERRLRDGSLDKWLDAGDKETLEANIRTARNYATAQENAAAVEARRRAAEASELKRGEYMASLTTGPGGAPRLPADFYNAILTDKTLQEADRSALYNVANAFNAEGAAGGIGAWNFSDLMQRAMLPDNDPNKLGILELSTYATSKDDISSFNFIANAIQGKDNPEKQVELKLMDSAMKAAAVVVGGEVNIISGERDPLNSTAVHAFNTWFQVEYMRRVKAGAEPISLLTPTSKDYMISPQILNGFKPSPDEQLGAFINRMQEKVQFLSDPGTQLRFREITQPRKPGETTDQYRARTR
jgi:hypothetical protein